jgi:glycyl-tRNA synthetase (class II)
MLNNLQNDYDVVGLTNIYFDNNKKCFSCIVRKQVGEPCVPKNSITRTRQLNLLHMDLFVHPSHENHAWW